MKLGEMNWPAIRELDKGRVIAVFLMIASFEQHGMHLPLLTDTIEIISVDCHTQSSQGLSGNLAGYSLS